MSKLSEENVQAFEENLILIVDDEPDLRAYYKETIEKMGLKVLCASDGVEALIILENEERNISLIICDLSMPIMSGIELYKNIVLSTSIC